MKRTDCFLLLVIEFGDCRLVGSEKLERQRYISECKYKLAEK